MATIARQAGEAVMQFYHKQNYQTQQKADDSPVTSADIAAHNILCEGLRQLDANSPIISEENYNSESPTKITTKQGYWLLDPLDGTREFINHSDQFTINIAYIQNQQPLFGLVYAPASDTLYYGTCQPSPSAYISHKGKAWQKIHSRQSLSPTLELYASLRHDNEEKLHQFLKKHYGFTKLQFNKCGSSLKFCLLAEGKGDAYLRLTPTHIWDSAAGHAVLKAAGGEVLNPHPPLTFPLTYPTTTTEADKTNNLKLKTGTARTESTLNPPFLAVSQALLSQLQSMENQHA